MPGAGVDFFLNLFFCRELAADPQTVWVGGPEMPPWVARLTFAVGMMMMEAKPPTTRRSGISNILFFGG